MAAQELSDLAGRRIELSEKVEVLGGPTSCPACGSHEVAWGCSDFNQRTREQIHPLVWHETEWMADSFLCRACGAGWIEPDDPEPIMWVRPWWVDSSG